MNRQKIKIFCILGALFLTCLHGFAAANDERILLKDGFETLQTAGDKTCCTLPEIGAGVATNAKVTGKIKGPAEIIEGQAGKALRLTGLTQVRYVPARGLVDLTGGEISFRIALNFDPTEKNKKTRTVLRNQLFFRIMDGGHNAFSIYQPRSDAIALIVVDAARNQVLYKDFPLVMKPKQWHQIKLQWGKQLELWCDGEKKISCPWEGLFGSLPFNLDDAEIQIGSKIGWTNVESEFSIDELVIKGPQKDLINKRPRMVLPLLTEEPALDGQLTDPFWTKAARVTGFVEAHNDRLSGNQHVIYAAYTAKGVYFGIEVTLAAQAMPRAMLTERDSGICSEDTLEFFLQPQAGGMVYHQFMASAAGTQFDSKITDGKHDLAYNPEWEVKTTSRPGGWTAEIFVPYQALGLAGTPAAGTVWRGNFCVDSSAGLSSAATWAFIAGNFQQPVYFGELLFAGKERALRMDEFKGFREGEPRVLMKLVGEYQPIITVRSELTDSGAKNLFKNDQMLRDANSVTIKPPFLTAGMYALTISGEDEQGQQVFWQSYKFQTTKAFDIALERYPYAGYLAIKANARGIKDPIGKIVCNVLGADKRKVTGTEITALKAGMGEGRVPLDQLPPGDYEVEANAMSADGKVLDTARQQITIYKDPAWMRNDIGVDHTVPPPFEPVKETAGGLGVWGREYIFDKGVFPKQIVSQKEKLLSRSPVFTLKAGGQTIDIGLVEGKKENAFPDVVSVSGSQVVGDMEMVCRTALEFDGCLRCDLTLKPGKATKVEELTLCIPMSKNIAQFLLASTGKNCDIKKLEKDFSSSFLPYLWLGNDDMGMAWFAESDEVWNPKDGNMLQVIPGDKEVVLKVNFVTAPMTLDKPATWTFGLMASPVRPVPENDPFAYTPQAQDTVKGKYTFSECLIYSMPKEATGVSGTLEFYVKRSAERSPGRTELFHFKGEKKGAKAVDCYLATPGAPDTLCIDAGTNRLLTAKAPIKADGFSHLAFTWDKGGVTCYYNGKPAGKGSAEAARELQAVLARENSQIRFGCGDEYTGYTGIILDEIRISKTARYSGESFVPSENPLTPDTDTVFLDNLDETFKPDGQDARTKAGGLATIGGAFVAAKFNQGLKLEVAPFKPVLEVMKDMDTKVSLWWFLHDIKYGWGPTLLDNTIVTPGTKDGVAAIHRYGIKTMPYTAIAVISSSSSLKLIERFGDEWKKKPVSTYPITWPKDYGDYWMDACRNAKGYANYYAAGVAWLIDEFDFDGYYTDGFCGVPACQNQGHGCGYVDKDGNLHSTWPVFAVRETSKRMYRVAKSKKPDGLVVNHHSFNLMLPTLSFSDIVYTGEHEDYENPLTARLRFSCRPWGLYITTLGSSQHTYSPVHEMASLLNGISVWGHGLFGRNDFGRKNNAIISAYREFNTKTSCWVPYHRGADIFYQVSDPKVLVSLYYHAGKDALLLAGNYNKEIWQNNIQLKLEKMGLAGKELKATNVLTEEDFNIAPDGRLSVKINPKSFLLIKLETKHGPN